MLEKLNFDLNYFMGNNEKKRKGWKNISTWVTDFMDKKKYGWKIWNDETEREREREKSDAGK